jgi:single-strand DNA-binding protein
VEGRLQTRSWEDKEGQKRFTTEVVCEDLVLLSGRGEGASGPPPGDYERVVSMPRSAPKPQPAPAAPPDDLNQGIGDDDVPF